MAQIHNYKTLVNQWTTSGLFDARSRLECTVVTSYASEETANPADIFGLRVSSIKVLLQSIYYFFLV